MLTVAMQIHVVVRAVANTFVAVDIVEVSFVVAEVDIDIVAVEEVAYHNFPSLRETPIKMM